MTGQQKRCVWCELDADPGLGVGVCHYCWEKGAPPVTRRLQENINRALPGRWWQRSAISWIWIAFAGFWLGMFAEWCWPS